MPGAKQLEIDDSYSDVRNGRRLRCDLLLKEIRGSEDIKLSSFHRRGAVLFAEGEQAQGVYVLRTGRAKVSISSADGRKLIIRIARAGEVLGLYAGLTGRHYEATAEMLEPGRVEFVTRNDFLDLMGKRRAFGFSVVQVVSQQFSDFVDHTRMLLLSESAVEKLSRLILLWSRDFGEHSSEGTHLRIWLTQEEIAQTIGASRETVTRLFGELRRAKIIRVKGGEMTIRNRDALASLAQVAP